MITIKTEQCESEQSLQVHTMNREKEMIRITTKKIHKTPTLTHRDSRALNDMTNNNDDGDKNNNSNNIFTVTVVVVFVDVVVIIIPSLFRSIHKCVISCEIIFFLHPIYIKKNVWQNDIELKPIDIFGIDLLSGMETIYCNAHEEFSYNIWKMMMCVKEIYFVWQKQKESNFNSIDVILLCSIRKKIQKFK